VANSNAAGGTRCARAFGEWQTMLSVVLCVLEHLEAHGVVGAELDSNGIRRFRAV
jgi:hypothetical protein